MPVRGLAALLLCLAPLAAQTPAEDLIAAGHWKRARALVEPHWRQHPEDALANFLMSQIRAAFGDRESPRDLAEKAVTLDPRVAKFHRQLAEVMGIEAEHANIIRQGILAARFKREIELALVLDQRDIQALRDLMEYYLLAPGLIGGDKAKAREVADRIAAIGAAEGFLARARLGDPGALAHAVEVGPMSYKTRIALAGFLLSPDHRDLDTAERHAREALRMDPTRADAYAILAVIHADRGQWSQLETVLADSEAAVPDDFIPYYRVAEALITRGAETPRAARYLRKYLSQPPEGNQPTLAEAAKKLARLR